MSSVPFTCASRGTATDSSTTSASAPGNVACTLTVGGVANASGTIHLYIAGVRVRVAVTAGDALTDIATAISAVKTMSVV